MDLELLKAAKEGNEDEVDKLLKKGANASFEQYDPGVWGASHRESVIHGALSSGNLKIIKMILDGGAKVNVVFEDYDWRGCGSKNTAFQMALDLSMHTSNAELLSLFLKYGGDANTECVFDSHTMRFDGRRISRPLYDAVSKNELEIVKVLLDGGADVNAHFTNRGQSEYGSAENTKESPLHCACMNGYFPIVELLLKHGANINDQRDFLENIHNEVSSPVRDPRDSNYVSGIELKPLKETPLHLAILNNHPEIVSLLITNGADISIPRISGNEEESSYPIL